MQRMIRRAYRRLVATVQLALLSVQDRRSYQVIRQVRRDGLSFLGPAALLELATTVRTLEARHVAGLFVETGAALGGSALVIAAAKAHTRPLWLYDVFGLIPSPSAKDGEAGRQRFAEIAAGAATGVKGGVYYGYRDDLLETVRKNFQHFGFDLQADQISLIRGLYEETLRIEEPVAFAHIDCDWYDSVMICLERIVPHLSPGGVLVIDDYFEWPGCKQAVDHYFAGRQDEFRFVIKARLHIERQAAGTPLP